MSSSSRISFANHGALLTLDSSPSRFTHFCYLHCNHCLGPSGMERCQHPSFHHQPCFLQTFEKGNIYPLLGSILEYSARCTFDILASPQISRFVSRRRGQCSSSCGSWPFQRGTPFMCSTLSVPSSCITGEQRSLTLSGEVGSFVVLGTHSLFTGE